MIGKIDLRRKGDGEDTPLILELIQKYKGVIGDAERAAGLSLGLFSKIRTGRLPFSDFLRQKVQRALEAPYTPSKPPTWKTKQMSKPVPLPETCPQLLAQLIQHTGSKAAAMRVLGCSDGLLYRVIGGSQEMPGPWIVKAKAALGLPVIGEAPGAPAAPAAPSIPEFVPWDGKTKMTVSLNPPGGKKKGRIVKVAEPLGKLIQMFPNMSQAAQSMGHSSGSLTAMVADSSKFTERWQRKVHRALHGLPPDGAPTMGEDFDKYQTGFAIVMLASNAFDRIRDLADILNGQLVFRRNTKAGWIIVYRMAADDLPKFKRLGLRDAHEIVCP